MNGDKHIKFIFPIMIMITDTSYYILPLMLNGHRYQLD